MRIYCIWNKRKTHCLEILPKNKIFYFFIFNSKYLHFLKITHTIIKFADTFRIKIQDLIWNVPRLIYGILQLWETNKLCKFGKKVHAVNKITFHILKNVLSSKMDPIFLGERAKAHQDCNDVLDPFERFSGNETKIITYR